MKLSNSSFLTIIILGLLFMVIGVKFHSGVKENYLTCFVLPVMFCPFIIMVSSKSKISKDMGLSVITILFFWLSAEIFWDYMDRPWFSPEPTHEGQYGWFSFENDLRWQVFPILGSISLATGTIFRQLVEIFKKK